MSSPTVAAFDLDRTLTVRDCVVPFLSRCRSLPALLGRGVLAVPTMARATVRRDRDLVKQAATRVALAGRPVDEVERIAADFAAMVTSGWLRSDTTARLEWHQRQGHRVVVVSASYELYVRHIAASLGVEAVLATRVQRHQDHFSGTLEGRNCRGPEKPRRLFDWMDSQVGPRGSVELWAYGDSAGDAAMLAAADHGVWVGRSPISVIPERRGGF